MGGGGAGARPVAVGGDAAAAGASSQKVLEEIEELTNPKLKAGKKALDARAAAAQGHGAGRAGRGARRIQQGCAWCAWFWSPRAAKHRQQELINTLLAHTSLETSASINLTMVGMDGRPDAEIAAPDAAGVAGLSPDHAHAAQPAPAGPGAGADSHLGRAAGWCCCTSTR